MNYCLIEMIDNNPLPDGYIYVALTPKAIYQLDNIKVEYITFEDFYNSGDIRADADLFLEEQLQWFNKLDHLLKENYPKAKSLNLNLGSTYFYWLKYFIDNIILTRRILNIFVKSAKPSKILFISEKFNNDSIHHLLHFQNVESTYSRLIKYVCLQNNIEFERINIDNKPLNTIINTSLANNLENNLPTLFSFLKQARNFINRKKFVNILDMKNNQDSIKIFFLTITNLIYRVSLDLKNESINYSFYSKKILNQKNNQNINKEGVVLNGTNSFIKNDKIEDHFYSWVNNKCELDVSLIIKSRVEKFIYDICPNIISKVESFINYYDNQKIDYVFTDQIYTIDEHAAIIAAKHSMNTKSAYFHHGADAFESKSRYFKLVRFFDYYFTVTKEEAEHERSLRNLNGDDSPRIYSINYFIKPVDNDTKKIKNTILFIPIMCSPWPQRPNEKNQPFPMEYIAWHKALVHYFSRRDDYDFIWKGYFLKNQQYDIIKNLIDENGYTNVKYYSNNLNYWLSRVDKVVCDMPSSAFFEAIFYKKSVLALYNPKEQKLRKNAYDAFGLSLAPYTNIEEGISLVNNFIDSKHEDYLVNMNNTQDSLEDVLFKNNEN